MSDLVAKIIDWANINSYSYNLSGLAKMLNLIKTEFESFANLEIQELDLAAQNYINRQGELEKRPLGRMLIVRKSNPQAQLRVLLGGHMDTVYPPDHSFQRCETLDSKSIRGPGVADLKGGLVVMIEALRRFEASPEASNLAWTVFINPDEELGSPGSAPILARLAKEHDLALVYEPSLADGSLAYRRMGTGNFTILAHGKSSHVGRDFKSGRNALMALAELALILEGLNAENNNIILNVANIISEGPLNVVPDFALLRFNIRLKDNISGDIILTKIHEEILKISKNREVAMKLEGAVTSPAKIPDSRLEALYKSMQDCGRELGLELRLQDTGGCCDGNKLWASGLANIDTLGVRGGQIHSDQEFILVDSIEERIQLSLNFLKKLSLNHVHYKTS